MQEQGLKYLNKMEKEDKAFIEEVYDGMVKLLEQKNDAYGDSYALLRDEEGSVGFRIRLSDKVNRVKTIYKAQDSGSELSVGDEQVEKTIEDIIGYCTLELLYLHKRKEKEISEKRKQDIARKRKKNKKNKVYLNQQTKHNH